MNITDVLLCLNWKERLDTSAVLASGANEKGRTFKNRSTSVNVQCQIIKMFSVSNSNAYRTHQSVYKLLKSSEALPEITQRKHTEVCANSSHLVILQLLSARCRFSTFAMCPLWGCMKQQSPTPLSPHAQVRQTQVLFSSSFCWRAQSGLNHKSNISQHCWNSCTQKEERYRRL